MAFLEKFTLTPRYIPKPSRRRSGLPINRVRFLVAHDTGNPGSTARGNVSFYIDTCNTVPKAKTASAHIFVDDKEIIECVPALTGKPEKAWHVLYKVPKDNELYGVNANDAAIGVEYCFGGKIDADKAYEKYVWVLARLIHEFKLDPAKDVIGHFFLDPQRKTDPATGLLRSRRTYDKLLKDVVEEYFECLGDKPVVPNELSNETGTLQTAVRLNVRSKPNTKSTIVQTLAAGATVDYKGIVKNGEKVNNNPVWYMDANGNFLWSGGLVLEETIGTPKPVTKTTSPAETRSAAEINVLRPDDKCIDFIKMKEGLRLDAYKDVAGVWTIGYGTIRYSDNRVVKAYDTITLDQAETLLKGQVLRKSLEVNAVLNPVVVRQNQYNALVSFAYNVGVGALKKSTLLRLIKVDQEDPKIKDAFMMWNKAHVDGMLVEVEGLKIRRQEEAEMYFS